VLQMRERPQSPPHAIDPAAALRAYSCRPGDCPPGTEPCSGTASAHSMPGAPARRPCAEGPLRRIGYVAWHPSAAALYSDPHLTRRLDQTAQSGLSADSTLAADARWRRYRSRGGAGYLDAAQVPWLNRGNGRRLGAFASLLLTDAEPPPAPASGGTPGGDSGGMPGAMSSSAELLAETRTGEAAVADRTQTLTSTTAHTTPCMSPSPSMGAERVVADGPFVTMRTHRIPPWPESPAARRTGPATPPDGVPFEGMPSVDDALRWITSTAPSTTAVPHRRRSRVLGAWSISRQS
jgi:hypothetical protein